MYSNKLAEALAHASEADKVELAHFLANNIATAEQAHDSAYVRQVVAVLDRFAAPEGGRS